MLRNEHADAKPRFVVREKASKSGRGRWAVVDRFKHKIDSRYAYPGSARMVADELNRLHRDQVARMAPLDGWDRDRDGWLSPAGAPAEAQDIDEVDPADRAWWARQNGRPDDDRTIDGLAEDAAHAAWLDELEHQARVFATVPESELVEFGLIRRPA